MSPSAALRAATIAALALVAGAVTWAASQRMSATFDEIVLVSGGVRGLATGRWDMVTDQPPLMMVLYGSSARGAVDVLPPEDRAWTFDDRWDYSRALFFGLGNDTDAVLGRARAVGALFAAATVTAAGAFAWCYAGPAAGILAATLTALLPDVLAHGGVAYNDLPLAFFFLVAVWALDMLVRRPTPTRGAVAGLAVAAALGVKLSALALGPIALLLVAAEAWSRREDPDWRRDLAFGVGVAGLAAYAGLVLLYRGDLLLTLFRFNFWRTVLHASGGHEAPAYLLGATSAGGWWYYFPVAALFKTPAPFQASVVVAGVVLAAAARREGRGWARLVSWRGRAALLGALVFGLFLLRSDLNAGFRYALPALPLLAVVVALAFSRAWPCCQRSKSIVVGGLIALQAISTLSAYPHFLAYSSVWAGGRDRAYRVLADSNVDWGQGLLELRRFMDDEDVTTVSLSYFGSAVPEAYGIEYVALPSFFRLPSARTPGADPEPRFTVVSATNLVGLYLQGRDPYASYRDREPYRVLGHALFVYDDLR